MNLLTLLLFVIVLFGPAATFLLYSFNTKNRGNIWFMVVAAAVMIISFLIAHQVLVAAYTESVVVGTHIESVVRDHQRILTRGDAYTYEEPEYQHENLYHYILWLLPPVLLLLVDGLHDVLRPTKKRKYLLCGTLLFIPYLYYSYELLINGRERSIFYVNTIKPKGESTTERY